MINNLKHTLHLGMLKPMIQCRKGKELQKAKVINSNAWLIVTFYAEFYQVGKTYNTKNKFKALYDTVYEFLLNSPIGMLILNVR